LFLLTYEQAILQNKLRERKSVTCAKT